MLAAPWIAAPVVRSNLAGAMSLVQRAGAWATARGPGDRKSKASDRSEAPEPRGIHPPATVNQIGGSTISGRFARSMVSRGRHSICLREQFLVSCDKTFCIRGVEHLLPYR